MSFTLVLFSILSGVVAFGYWFIHQKLQHWKKLKVPHTAPEFFFGNARGLGTTKHLSELVIDTYLKFKSMTPVCGLYISIRQIAVATDLELVKNILVKDSANFLNRGIYYNEKDDPLSATMFHIEDEGWQFLRNKISPTFTSGKIKAMYPSIFEVSERLVKKINSVGNLDVAELFGQFTTDVIGSCAFGIECNSLEDKETDFHEIGKSVLRIDDFAKYQFCLSFPNLARKLGITVFKKWMTDFYLDVVRKTIDHRDANPLEERKDFLSLMMALRDPKSTNPLTFNQIAAQAFTFFVAGFDTTTTSLTYCTYQLSLHKDIQEKARKSVFDAMAKHGNVLTYECLADMKYLDQCLNESMRINPVGYITTREVKEDYPVPNSSIVLEKGSLIIVPIVAIQRDPDIYPDPLKFDPERFSSDEMNKRNPFTFLAFGEGPRICLGKRFAYLEMKIALAQILMNFDFGLDAKTISPIRVDPKPGLIFAPLDEIRVVFKKRN